MPAPLVFFDIAGPDTVKLQDFYHKIFGWDIQTDGRFSVDVHSPLGATFRSDPTEKLLYLGVDDINATMVQIEAEGGKTAVPRFEVTGVVVIGIFEDPAGNRIGLVELENGDVKAP